MARDPAFNTITRTPRAIAGGTALQAPADALANPTGDDLITAAMTLWPQGSAWGSPDGQAASLSSLLARFTRVLLDPFVWLHGRAFQLAREASLQGVNELLPDWEAEYGLPEPCFAGSGQTTAQRLTALSAKVRADAVNHPEEFVRLALDYGFEIEIEEPAIFECGFSEIGGYHTPGFASEETFWIVRVKDVGLSYFEAGAGECGVDPLFSFGEAEQLICLLRQMAPAWTLPVLASWINYGALSDGAGNAISDGFGHPILVPLNT
ncbi:DUF2313 domain-containing protein [Rhizobiaceae bacterium n13]|uniref:putative phage tail protein n=1 Tax=Ferirhizobium litorale TaxID=2927786 RepID=UPI0024B2DC02|nr:putative phage tail protein [Fererhizobium litorale]MDI7864287.1 DUF2313 domain-containing protein [Fererhizobium litorale]